MEQYELRANSVIEIVQPGNVIVKEILPQIVFVLPPQVMNPMVNLNDNLELPIDEYGFWTVCNVSCFHICFI